MFIYPLFYLFIQLFISTDFLIIRFMFPYLNYNVYFICWFTVMQSLCQLLTFWPVYSQDLLYSQSLATWHMNLDSLSQMSLKMVRVSFRDKQKLLLRFFTIASYQIYINFAFKYKYQIFSYAQIECFFPLKWPFISIFFPFLYSFWATEWPNGIQ